MDVTDEHIASVFKEALICYLGILSRANTIRDANLPKHGKSSQTDSDISVEEEFRTRVAATELCLQYTQDLAASVCHWASEPLKESNDNLSLANEDPTSELESFLPNLDDYLLLDIFSGKWVEPATPFLAGPSHRLVDTKSKTLSEIFCFGGETETKSQESRPFPNQLMETSNLFNTNPHFGSSSLDKRYRPPTNLPLDMDREHLDALIARLSQPKRVPSVVEKAAIPNKSVQQAGYSDLVQRLSRPRRALDPLETPPTLPPSTQRTVRMDVIRRLSQPKSPCSRIETTVPKSDPRTARREVIQRQSQPKRQSARILERTTTARSIQHPNTSDVIQRLSQPRQTPSKIEQKRKPIRSDQLVSPLRLSVRPKTPENKLECVVCMSLMDKRRVFLIPCQHIYCRGCLVAGFKSALSSRKLFKCCGARVPTKYARENLPIRLVASYETLVMELTTRNPIYCSKTSCGAFIPSATIKGPVATCAKYLGISSKKCGSKTCVMCKKAVHKGVCKEDKDGMLVKALAKEMHWKTCPRCGEMVSKNGGCLHMSCRCGAEWCWNCLRAMDVCNQTCLRQ